MLEDKKYSESQIKNTIKNLARLVSSDQNNSIFVALSRVLSDDEFLSPKLKAALEIADDNQAQKEFDETYKELTKGDHAVFLQATHTDIFENLKNCLNEFRRSEYGASSIYAESKSLEPEFFFPRLFQVKVVDTAIRNNRRLYLCKLTDDDAGASDVPMACPEENMFVSQQDILDVERVYRSNLDRSVQWLKAVGDVKTSELKDIITKLTNSIEADQSSSLRSLEAYKSLQE